MAEIALDIQIELGKSHKDIAIELEQMQREVKLAIDKGSGRYFPDYKGGYVVTSSLYDVQTLETRNKRMKEDMKVLPIPIHTVINPSGGYTITIGE